MSNQANTQHELALERAHQACHAPIWIRDVGALAQAVELWKQRSLLALDTEFMRERTYYPQLALVQVSDGEQVWLIDSPELAHHQALATLLSDTSVVKVLHSPREDLEVLYLATGELPRPLFDTQAAAAICGDSLQSSYAALLTSTLGVKLDKELARSDWLQRPLTPEQVLYASCDVAYLPLLAQHLQQRLQTLQRRTWLEDDMQNLLRECLNTTPDTELYLGIPGAGRLQPNALKILHSLCIWREQIAREQNLPRQFVVRNEMLLQLAIQPPTQLDELFRSNAIRPSQARRHGPQLLQLIENALHSPAVPAVPMLSPEQQQKVKKAQKFIRHQAEHHAVEAAVLLSRRDIERWLKEGQDCPPSRMQSWRWSLFGEELSQILWS